MAKQFVEQSRFRPILVRAVVVPLVLVVGLAVVLLGVTSRLISTAGWVEHTDQVIAQINELEKLHVDMETGLRGYLITHQRRFLEPFDRAIGRIDPVFNGLELLTADNPRQQQRLREIRVLKDKWVAYSKKVMDLRDGGGAWTELVQADAGKDLMDDIRGRFAQVVKAEESLRSDRTRASQRASKLGLWSVGILALVVVGGALVVFFKQQLQSLTDTYERALATARDLTGDLERRVTERTKELATANDSLAEANKELEAFAYSISHDLRAPMRHIAGFADLLRKSVGPELKPDDAENLDTIHETAKLAGRMVDDLLGLSRVGRTTLGVAMVDMAGLLEECRRVLEPETSGREIHWQVHDLPQIRGDRSLLKLMLQNLVANAVKYSGGRPVAEIEVGARQENGGITYWIKDNGVGFDMEYVDKLFGVFQRLHRAEDFEGTGIGLANVRRIILRHGGRVWAEGQLGRGATFSFWLPTFETEKV